MEDKGTRDGRTTQGMTETWAQDEGGKGGSAQSHKKPADTGMRYREQGKVAEAGG